MMLSCISVIEHYIMKESQIYHEEKYTHLFQGISSIKNDEEARLFFIDLCTPTELDAMADRWAVIPLLKQGVPYRAIHDRTGVSVATITRIARCLVYGEGGYDLIFKRVKKHE